MARPDPDGQSGFLCKIQASMPESILQWDGGGLQKPA